MLVKEEEATRLFGLWSLGSGLVQGATLDSSVAINRID